ncbi:MAG: hypothetical protein OXI26_05995 [bacterium]|nr:hypothetical protein [bacterium]
MTVAAGLTSAVDLAVSGVVLASTLGTALKALAAALGGLAILWLGILMLRVLSQPQPEPPPPGELRKVRITYRCSLCGTEVRMTIAPMEDPEPPRHCGEEMSVMAPIED